MVELLEGKIEYSNNNEAKSGTIFTLTLPIDEHCAFNQTPKYEHFDLRTISKRRPSRGGFLVNFEEQNKLVNILGVFKKNILFQDSLTILKLNTK